MHDYPNHLARIHILHQYGDNESYQATYSRDLSILPNQAMDLIVPALMDVVSIEYASKIFLSLVVGAINFGFHCLGLAVNGRPHWNALAATFFTYNFAFAYGFVNYLFGLGAYLITFSVWLWSCSRWTFWRIVSVSALAMICYVSHLSAFVFLGVSITFFIGCNVSKSGKFPQFHQLLGLIPLLLPVSVHILHGAILHDKGGMTWWHPLVSKKLVGLAYPFLTYDLVVDLSLGLVFIFLVSLATKRKGPRLVCPELFLLGVVFLILYVLSPMSGVQTSYIDRRFLLPAIACLLLGIRLDLSRQIGQYAMVGLIGLSFVRGAEVWYFGDRIAREVQSHVRMLDILPDGVRLYPLVVHNQSSGQRWLWDMHFFYTAHYATVYRHAFVPTIYAWKGAHPLNLRSAVQDYAQIQQDTSMEQVNWSSIFSKYDYLWGYNLSDEFRRFLLAEHNLVAESGNAMLIRIGKGVIPEYYGASELESMQE